MRRIMLSLLLLSSIPGLGLAQTSDQPRGQGYAFFAPGGATSKYATTGTIHFGAGSEALVYRGFGVGGEVGYVAPTRSLSNGLRTLSLDGSYHFLPSKKQRKVVPFATGGYTLFFRSGTANLFNFGGGINYWFRERAGLRLEFRDHVWPGEGGRQCTTGDFASVSHSDEAVWAER